MTGTHWLMLCIALLAAGLVYALALLKAERRHFNAESSRINRLNRFLAAHARASRLFRSYQREEELWQAACRMSVETGYAVLACVYAVDGAWVRRLGSAGPATRILENVPNPFALDAPEMRGTYTVRALLDGTQLVSNDYVLDPRAGRWREEAVDHRIRSIAWLPIRRDSQVHAVLMLCAGEPNFFDSEMLAVLGDLTEEMAFALDCILLQRQIGTGTSSPGQ